MENEMPAAQYDVWTSILSQKHIHNNDAYIHPLVKRSSSSLSDESLQICTESLGSETGSDICLSSSSGDEQLRRQQQQGKGYHGIQFPNKSYGFKLHTTAAKSFPPPLTSLSRADATSIRMHSHRQNGRLVLKAVSVPSQGHFNAQRHDGRLTLTIAKTPPITMEDEDESNEYDDNEEEEDEEELEEEAHENENLLYGDEVINCDMGMMGVVASKRSPVPQVMNNHNYKVMRPLANENPATWLKLDEQQDVQQESQLGTRLNVYENSWKGKAANVVVGNNTYIQTAPPVKNNTVMNGRNEGQKVVLVKGGSINEGCKDTRLFWQSSLNCVV